MNEFEIIKKYFAPLSHDGLKNDAAILDIPNGQKLIVTSDTLNAGIHFIENADASQIAHKALRTNISDLAAMGAQPFAYQLCLAFPEKPTKKWLEFFTKALQEDQNEFGIFCSGGDTTRIKGSLSISITALGLVPKGQAISRNGAKNNDAIILTGSVGDAYIGLQILSFLSLPYLKQQSQRKKINLDKETEKYFIEQYYKPQPRIDLIKPIRKYAHAAIDISDGLIADLSHICIESNLSAQINLTPSMFSTQAQKVIKNNMLTAEELLVSGDDYQLLLAIPENNVKDFLIQAPKCIQIGQFKKGKPIVTLMDKNNRSINIKHTGWSHF
ncbi:MAG: thiamine-phosphate kinase [Alphaproteobacteria bacterium]|nr:thiamine-phosphate kinase [Alphaproteobacteria bacterium]